MNFKSNKNEVKQKLDEAKRRTLEGIGAFIDAEATVRAPVGQYEGGAVGGNLRGSINHVTDEESVTIGTPVHYAPYVEKGTGIYAMDGQGRTTPWVYRDEAGNFRRTHGMRPQPFLTPAVEENFTRLQRLALELMKI